MNGSHVCPVCEDSDVFGFFEIAQIPVQDGILWPTREEATHSPTGRIHLSLCENCGYIWNDAFEPGKIRYIPGYNFSLWHSPVYQDFVRELTADLVSTYDLRGKTIIEIGCGDGHFLNAICALGRSRGIGFDPVHQHRLDAKSDDQVQFVQDYYSDKYSEHRADFICCRQVLQSISHPSHPKSFLTGLRKTIAGEGVVLYFEVPNASYILGQQIYWYVTYEYSSYFTAHSLSRLFESCGFEVCRASPVYESGQYLGIEAVAAVGTIRRQYGPHDGIQELKRQASHFSDAYRSTIDTWRTRMEELRSSGKRVAAWGAGGRAIGFLNALQIRDQIPFVVDINPERQGQYLPATGQVVVSPQHLAEYRPDTLIITNPTYTNEIERQVQQLGVACEFLVL
jgi:2-polyprenyl-3-methyl-5-hydroxy-6-metoxy-1,4-benzoquinol methylase